jgi:hypothetical protein
MSFQLMPAKFPKDASTVSRVSSPPARPFLERRAVWIAVAAILVASLRICATYTVFNHTSDEPNHIACGIEWIQKGTYTFETQHPPLARVAAAIGPYLIGARTVGEVHHDTLGVPIEGSRILSRNHEYDLTLALARLGILPFFWIACLVVFWWARRLFGPAAGAVAVAFFSFLPPILAHAGLATTDMVLATFVGAAFVAAIVWVQEPTTRHAVLFGLASGLALLSKFSSIPFLPACLGCALALYVVYERPRRDAILAGARRALPSLGVAILVGLVVVWAGFRFSFGSPYPGMFPVPAPELFTGLQAAMHHNQIGHHTYLLGQFSSHGFWYYYPVILAVKTPLAFLALAGFGLYLAIRKRGALPGIWQPLGLIAGVMAVGWYSRINIGVRHILPIYMGLSVLAAIGCLRLRQKPVLAILLLWFAGSSLLAHPDYLPYFNELAGSQPEKIVVDSDLDWGQDIKRLSRRLHEVHADHISFLSTLVASFYNEFHMPPITKQDPFSPAPGWNAVSVTFWKLGRLGLVHPLPDGSVLNDYPDRTLWPDTLPPGERVGKSIILWNIVPK